MRLVVLGGDAAGMTAANHVLRREPETEVVVVERGSHTSYSMCGIPYYVGGEIETADELVVRTPEEFEQQGMTVHMGTEAIAVDARARRVTVRELASGVQREVPYDELLYALGAHPSVPDLPGLGEHGYVVHTLDEGERLRAALDRRDDVRSVVVVGAGYIGMELAEALVQRGLQATLVDMSEQVMRALDPDMAAHVQEALTDFGVRLALGERLERIDADDAGCHSVQTDQGEYPADLVVLAMGARPNVELAATAGCRVGESGALAVDDAQRTNVDHVWAAGDCVESTHLVSGAQVNVQLGTHANKQAKIAAINLTGGDARFPGVVGTAVTKVCDWEIARTGLSVREAEDAGFDFAVASFTGSARAGYMPDPGMVHVKMMAERGSGRMLGAQLVGTGNVGKRIDTAATWCQLGVSVADAQLFDLSYAPPFGGVWDLLAVGARKLVNELDLSPRL